VKTDQERRSASGGGLGFGRPFWLEENAGEWACGQTSVMFVCVTSVNEVAVFY
jgi:hypothetical protein